MSIDMLFFVRRAGACPPPSLVVPVSSSGSPEPERGKIWRFCTTGVMRVDGIQTHGAGNPLACACGNLRGPKPSVKGRRFFIAARGLSESPVYGRLRQLSPRR